MDIAEFCWTQQILLLHHNAYDRLTHEPIITQFPCLLSSRPLIEFFVLPDSHVHALEYGAQKQMPLENTQTVDGKLTPR
jgi:hypothetical protein